MKILKQIFDFYLNSSIHVSLAASVLVLLTYYYANLPINYQVFCFVFFATLVSYNIIKYASFIFQHKVYKNTLKAIILLTILSAFIGLFLFFNLSFKAQIVTLIFGILNLLYLLPLGKGKLNLRNFAGIKIYIVSLCWAGVTLLIPLYNELDFIGDDIVFKFIQRFILTLSLILIFEINDLKYDDIRLKTVPQTIGIKNTKRLVYFLMLIFYVLDFFKNMSYPNQWIVNLIIVLVTYIACFFVSTNRSKYYTLFWVESIPILWYLLTLIA